MGLFDIFRLKTKLSGLEDRMEALEREFKQIELEWSSTYDNVRRLFAKISKRDQRAQETHEDAPGSTIPGQSSPGSLESINEQIRASRRRP